MQKTLKICASCSNLQVIWKNYEGNKYCKSCWYNNFQNKTSKINPRSKKKIEQDKIYSVLRKNFLNSYENSTCRAKFPGCLNSIKENLTIHHTKGRGKYYLDISTWIPLCLTCHEYVERHPKESRELGFSGSKLI